MDRSPGGITITGGNVVLGSDGKIFNVAEDATSKGTREGASFDANGVITNITANVKDFRKTQDLTRCLDRLKRENYVTLTGLSGVGKTEIAKYYWETKKADYDVGWLIPSETDQELRIAIRLFLERLAEININVDLTEDLPLPNVLSKIHLEIRRNTNRGYLLIFDDVKEETHRAIVQGFASKPNISVIITTEQTLHPSATDESIQQVEGFSEDEVLEFLDPLKNETRENKIQLWEEMSHLPSALACARFDILNTQRSIKFYLAGIKERKLYQSIEKRDHLILGHNYKKPPIEAHVQNALTMIEELEKDDPALCLVFKTIGFFDSKAIPVFILNEILKQHSDPSQPVEHIDYHIDKLLMKMRDRSYVNRQEEKHRNRFIDTHELVQLGVRFAMKESDNKKTLEILMRVLLRFFAKDTRYMTYFRRNTILMPHVESVLVHLQRLSVMDITFDMKVMAIAMYDILGYSYAQSDFREVAEQKLQTSKDLMYKSLNIDEEDLDLDIRAKLPDEHKNDEEEFAYQKAIFIYEKLQSVGNKLVENLVLNTVLNETDVDIMKSKIKGNKLPELLISQKRTDRGSYTELVKMGLAISEDIMKSIYLPELYASVFYSYGRMYFYKKQEGRVKINSFISAIRLSSALCKRIFEMTGKVVFHSILTKRNALLYLYSEDIDEYGDAKTKQKMLEDLYQGKKEYQSLLEEVHKQDWFQHGILKVTKNDFFHQCVCFEKGIFICMKILKLETDQEKKEIVIREGKEAIKKQSELLHSQEREEQELHRGSDVHVVAAEFYEEAKCWQEAYEYYKEAIERSKSANGGWLKKYGRSCEGIMRVAKRIKTKEALTEAKKRGEAFIKKAPGDTQHKGEIMALTQEISAELGNVE
ncbi:unnamed protein product [Owenia fusiformis]|nr:unnamed protein product [Owenia fusiformis]